MSEELDQVLRALPVCSYCRRTKKRCDTSIPACANCNRAELECVYFDAVADQHVSRQHIAALMKQAELLETGGSLVPHIEADDLSASVFVWCKNAYRYVGTSSMLALQAIPADDRIASVLSSITSSGLEMVSSGRVGESLHHFLVDQYLRCIQGAYPILELASSVLRLGQEADKHFSSFESYAQSMVYSIACHCLPCGDTRLLLLSKHFFEHALQHAEVVTSKLDMRALQAVCFLALQSLFDPSSGSIGQQIAFAQRLVIELEATATPEEAVEIQRLQGVMFCLASRFSTVMDRASPHFGSDSASILRAVGHTSELVSLHVAQANVQNRTSKRQNCEIESPMTDRVPGWSPLLVAAWYETQLVVKPSQETALQLLRAFAERDMVLDAFVPYWVYRAGVALMCESSKVLRHEMLLLATRILDRCSQKWPYADTLRGMLSRQCSRSF